MFTCNFQISINYSFLVIKNLTRNAAYNVSCMPVPYKTMKRVILHKSKHSVPVQQGWSDTAGNRKLLALHRYGW